ncbi:MAG: hypothetical protein JW741_16330 [Sedimentisphaerales bacterium]|nr:hypothetical protein [Sedimentisphaerales bacterium]
MNTRHGRILMIGLLATGLLAVGCKYVPPMVTRTISITAAEDVCTKSVEVHLVGVRRYDRDRWASMSMSEYWQPENELRKSAKEYTHIIRFGEEPCTRVFGKKEPMREVWKDQNAEYLFVLADLPGVFDDLPGNNDARRVEVPGLDSKDWGWQKEIEIVIKSRAVEVRTIPETKQ